MRMSVLEQIYLQALPFVITEGQNQTKIPYCTVLYSSDTQIQIPDSSDPFLYLVINGTLRIFAETGISDYSAGNYLISSIDGPMTAKIFHGENASPFWPYVSRSRRMKFWMFCWISTRNF